MRDRRSVRLIVPVLIVMAVVGIRPTTGWSQSPVLVSGDLAQDSTALAKALQRHFRNAQAAVLAHDNRKAAAEIRQGAAYLAREAGRAPHETQAMLRTSAQELTRLAARVEDGSVTSDEELRAAFARADHALATTFQKKAAASRSHQAMSQLGQELQTAAVYLEQAWAWSGQQIEAATQAAIEEAQQVGKNVTAAAKQAMHDADKSLDAIETEIARFGQRQPPKKAPETPIVVKTDTTTRPGAPVNLTTAIMQVARDNIPAVVHIQVIDRQEIPNPFLPLEKYPKLRRYFGLPNRMPKKFERELIGVGTGMIIDQQGHILTNNHVVAGATKIQVLLADGNQYAATVVGTDPKTDLGVIQISDDKALPHVVFGDSDRVEVGQWVVAIGQPANLSQSVSQGIISAKHRTGITNPSTYQDFLQTDAAINPGNSGGPLLDLSGHVIGVNSAILSQSGGFEGIGFAIPSNMAAHVANALIAYGKVERGWMGVTVQDLSPDAAKTAGLTTRQGALVASVIKDGPADHAGLKAGDVILAYQDQEIPNAAKLRNEVANTTIGQKATVTVWRHGAKQQMRVIIGSLDAAYQKMAAVLKARLGVTVKATTDREAKRYGLPAPIGVVIQSVDPQGPLGKAGFEVDDMILAVDGQLVASLDSFISMITSAPEHQRMTLRALDHRTGGQGDVQVTLR
jgi:serine protease Do